LHHFPITKEYMTDIYSNRKIVPIANHNPLRFPKRLFVQNEDGSLSEIEGRIFYRIERDTRMAVGDNRPLFVEVE